jgi:hypothetical protein
MAIFSILPLFFFLYLLVASYKWQALTTQE